MCSFVLFSSEVLTPHSYVLKDSGCKSQDSRAQQSHHAVTDDEGQGECVALRAFFRVSRSTLRVSRTVHASAFAAVTRALAGTSSEFGEIR
jgi:hypothetical protein